GVVTTAELLGAGLTEGKLQAFVRRGLLQPVSHGAYADARKAALYIQGDPARERLIFVAAAVATAGVGAVASHQDAALVHGLALLDRPRAGVHAVTVQASQTVGRRRRAGVHLHTAAM